MPQMFLEVPAELDGVRADTAVAKLTEVTRSWAVEVLAAEGVLLDGKILKKNDKLRAGAQLLIRWQPKPEPTVVPELIAGLEIVHDDSHLVVVSKPFGVAAHPSNGWYGPTVLGGLAALGYNIATSGAAERQGIVHRLDQGTSGLMVVAKSEYAYAELKRQFKAREVTKTYHTVVHGHPDPFAGTIDAPIGRHPHAQWKFAVRNDGKHAITHYEMLEVFARATLLEIGLETGRTHQIRVHMAAIKHPCVGDITYGADPVLAASLELERQWLHASRLEFTHPGSGQRVEFFAPYTNDLETALERLSY